MMLASDVTFHLQVQFYVEVEVTGPATASDVHTAVVELANHSGCKGQKNG